MIRNDWQESSDTDEHDTGALVEAEMERLIAAGGVEARPAAGMCACGEPLHYTSPEMARAMEQIIAIQGEMVVVELPEGRWRVPRHFIGLHGIIGKYVPLLGFEPVASEAGST